MFVTAKLDHYILNSPLKRGEFKSYQSSKKILLLQIVACALIAVGLESDEVVERPEGSILPEKL